MTVSSAAADEGSGTLTIEGSGFGPRPFVTLNLIPLAVRAALDTRVVYSAPIGIMPPGLYFLTVSRGPGSGDTASIDVPLGGGRRRHHRPIAGDRTVTASGVRFA